MTRPTAAAAVWPCGHDRTAENTQRIGKAGVRCRVCRQRLSNKSFRKRHGVALDRQRAWPFDDQPTPHLPSPSETTR